MDPTIPVEISHPSGVSFRLNLTEAEIERFNSDEAYQTELLNKYYSMYQDGIISGMMPSDANQSTDPQPGTSSSGNPRPRQWSADDEENLIRLVSERPPLFDFRLPLKDRSRTIVQSLWEEIIFELNVDLTVEGVSKKWKSIRDSFIRARANINKKIASGSSAEEKLQAEKIRRNHKNYELLLFLDDTLTTRRTFSNLEEAGETLEENELRSPLSSPPITPSTSRPTSRPASRAQGQMSSTDEAFLSAIRELPKAKEFTPIENFCLRLADGLQRLPPRVSNQLQLDFLTKLTEAENTYLYNK